MREHRWWASAGRQLCAAQPPCNRSNRKHRLPAARETRPRARALSAQERPCLPRARRRTRQCARSARPRTQVNSAAADASEGRAYAVRRRPARPWCSQRHARRRPPRRRARCAIAREHPRGCLLASSRLMKEAISDQVTSEEGCEPQRKGVKIRLQKAHRRQASAQTRGAAPRRGRSDRARRRAALRRARARAHLWKREHGAVVSTCMLSMWPANARARAHPL